MSDVADHDHDKDLFDRVVQITKMLREREREEWRPPPNFSPEQIAAIREMADFWLGFRIMGKVAIWAQKVIKYVGWVVGGVLLYKGWAAGWLRIP